MDIYLASALQYFELHRHKFFGVLFNGPGNIVNMVMWIVMSVSFMVHLICTSFIILHYSDKTKVMLVDYMTMLCPEINKSTGSKIK